MWKTPTRSIYENRPNHIWRRSDGVEVRKVAGGLFIALEPLSQNWREKMEQTTESRTFRAKNGRRRAWRALESAQAAIDRERPITNETTNSNRRNVQELLGPGLRLRDYNVYPTQEIVSAAHILLEYDSPEEANLDALTFDGESHGFRSAEGNSNIPGAGGQATKAVEALLRFRDHGSIDQVIEDLHASWKRTVGPGTGNHENAYEPGMEKAKLLEPAFRKALAAWFNLSDWSMF